MESEKLEKKMSVVETGNPERPAFSPHGKSAGIDEGIHKESD